MIQDYKYVLCPRPAHVKLSMNNNTQQVRGIENTGQDTAIAQQSAQCLDDLQYSAEAFYANLKCGYLK
jgi:hypothetical protein